MDAQLQRDIQTVIGLADSFMDHWETDEGMDESEQAEAASARAEFEDAKARIAALMQPAPAQEPAGMVLMVCAECGSEDVRADAYAAWDFERQEWELTATFDKGHVCEDCGGECRLLEVAGPALEVHPVGDGTESHTVNDAAGEILAGPFKTERKAAKHRAEMYRART